MTEAEIPVPDLMNETINDPRQRIWDSPDLSSQLNMIFNDTFGESLTIPRDMGPNISFRIGSISADPIRERETYKGAVREMPSLSEQGHGMRAFVGLIISMLAGQGKIVIIDEPELFLHPPQARLLGRWLVQFRASGHQVILATHSSEILQGLFDAGLDQASLRIGRITRAANETQVGHIGADTIDGMVHDQLLRHSSVIDGLFYEGTIVCESGGDCLYYRAVLDSLETPAQEQRKPDIHFTHCSGKSRVHAAVRALRETGVAVASIVDIDIFQNESEFWGLLDAHGIDVTDPELRRRVSLVRRGVERKAQMPVRSTVRSDIIEVLDGSSSRELGNEEIQRIRSSVKQHGTWGEFKRLGEDFLTGDSRRALRSVLEAARAAGLFIVPIGERESFHRDVDRRDKNVWLARVFEENHINQDAAMVKDFMADIVHYIWRYQLATTVHDT